VVRRLIAAVLLAGATTSLTISADAAERPGAVEWTVAHFDGHLIDSVDTAPSGRIFVAGSGFLGGYSWLHAYLPDGTADRSFGDTGILDFRDTGVPVVRTLVQPDGRVLVVDARGFLRRFTPDGVPDSSFAPGLSSMAVTDFALQPDGRLIVVGVEGDIDNLPVVIVVARLLPDGSTDASFGSGGVTRVVSGDGASRAAVSLQRGGGLILTARRSWVPVIARLSPNGQLDATFGAGGLAPLQFSRPGWSHRVLRDRDPAPPAFALADGRIRVALSFSRFRERVPRMALIGLTKDGHPDRRFAHSGLALGPPLRFKSGGCFEPENRDSIADAIRDPRGAILVEARRTEANANCIHVQTAIGRFHADGRCDRSFGREGVVQSGGWLDQRLALLGEDRLLLGENTFDAKYGSFSRARLRALYAGYDESPPRTSVAARCHSMRITIDDVSGMDEVVVRADGRLLRRTTRLLTAIRPS
jgi:uncharacterized delta-60 repeat protein